MTTRAEASRALHSEIPDLRRFEAQGKLAGPDGHQQPTGAANPSIPLPSTSHPLAGKLAAVAMQSAKPTRRRWVLGARPYCGCGDHKIKMRERGPRAPNLNQFGPGRLDSRLYPARDRHRALAGGNDQVGPGRHRISLSPPPAQGWHRPAPNIQFGKLCMPLKASFLTTVLPSSRRAISRTWALSPARPVRRTHITCFT